MPGLCTITQTKFQLLWQRAVVRWNFKFTIAIFGTNFAPQMSTTESDQLVEKITAGVKLSIQRLIERTKKEDGELVVSRNGKIVHIKARDLKGN